MDVQQSIINGELLLRSSRCVSSLCSLAQLHLCNCSPMTQTGILMHKVAIAPRPKHHLLPSFRHRRALQLSSMLCKQPARAVAAHDWHHVCTAALCFGYCEEIHYTPKYIVQSQQH